MKNALLIAILLLIGVSCKKDSSKNDDPSSSTTTSTSTTTTPATFDGTINGKWKLVGGPSLLYVTYPTDIGDISIFYPNHRAYSYKPNKMEDKWQDWKGDPAKELYINRANEIDTLVVLSFKPNEIRTQRKSIVPGDQEPISTLAKVSDLQCPNITGIEFDPANTKIVSLQGNYEFVQPSDVLTNMGLIKYWGSTGDVVCDKVANLEGNYVTIQRNGCPTISYKLELGLWKKQ